MPLILSCTESVGGADNIIQHKPGLLGATYIYKGKFSSRALAKKFDLKLQT